MEGKSRVNIGGGAWKGVGAAAKERRRPNDTKDGRGRELAGRGRKEAVE